MRATVPSAIGHRCPTHARRRPQLQAKILALAAEVSAARRPLDHGQGQAGRASTVCSRREGRSRTSRPSWTSGRGGVQALGPGASAAYLLGADSFADLLDRSVMLDRLQAGRRRRSPTTCRTRGQRSTRPARNSSQAATERGACWRDRVAARRPARRVRRAAGGLAATGRDATCRHTAGRPARAKAAREAGALPFGDWAERFLRYIGRAHLPRQPGGGGRVAGERVHAGQVEPARHDAPA